MFDNIRLPVDVEQGAQGGPAFQTSIVALASGNEQRNEDWAAPRQTWNIGYGIQDRADYELVRDFFYARRGRARAFIFKDWSDFEATDQVLGIGDGATRTFLMVKTYEDDGPDPHVRRITRPLLDTLVVKVDGSVNTDFVTGDGGWIRFTTGHAPATDAVVTASFEFDVPVRFDVDAFPLMMDWSEAAEIPSLPVIETRDDFNAAPTAVVLTNITASIDENANVTTHTHIADISVTDDPFGVDTLTLTGADGAMFELIGVPGQERDGAKLYLKAGVSLSFALKPHLAVTVNVNDPAASGSHPQAHADLTLDVNDINSAPTIKLTNRTVVFADGTSTAAPLHVADIVVMDDFLGLRDLTLTGTDAASFALSGSLSPLATDPTTGLALYSGVSLSTVAGLDYSTQKTFVVNVNVGDSGLAGNPQGVAPFSVTFGVVPGTATFDTPGAGSTTIPGYTTLVIEGWAGGAGGGGFNTLGANGQDTTIAAMSLTAGKGFAAVADSKVGGLGGTATGGDTNQPGLPGNAGVDYAQTFGTGTGTFTPPGIQFYTAKGGDAGDGVGGGVSSTGAFYRFDLNVASNINVNGNPGTTPGAAGAGSLQYGVGSLTVTGSFPGVNAYGQGAPSGGGGSKFTKTFIYEVTPGFPQPGDPLDFVVGAGGLGGVSFANGGDGHNGRLKLTWS